MFRALFFLLVASAAHAESTRVTLVPQILDAQGVSEAAVKKVQKSTEALLKKLSGLDVAEGPSFKPGPRKACPDVACQKAVVDAAGAPAVALLSLRATKGTIAFDLSFWHDGERLSVEVGDADPEAPEVGLKAALDVALPAWAKRGWGALRLDAQPGAVVKLDGRPSKTGELISVPAGPHQLDVVYADGNAVLQRVDVPEGRRTRIDARTPPAVAAAAAPEGNSALRAVSFGLWTAGAVGISASLVAGSLARQTGAGQNPCAGDSRTCSTIDVATERQRQAQAYANTGNVLLGTGLALATAGAGLFVFDLVRTK